jgi:hypothetical protein
MCGGFDRADVSIARALGDRARCFVGDKKKAFFLVVGVTV